jgi:hypothetical protein
MATTSSGKHQARLPTDHFKKLHEETCPNHAYHIKNKLRDCGMMKNFMASGSLARGMEADEAPDKSNTLPFHGEDANMMIYDGHPLLRMHHMANPRRGTPAHYVQGHKDAWM